VFIGSFTIYPGFLSLLHIKWNLTSVIFSLSKILLVCTPSWSSL